MTFQKTAAAKETRGSRNTTSHFNIGDTGVKSWREKSLELKLCFDPEALYLTPQNPVHLYTTNSTLS